MIATRMRAILRRPSELSSDKVNVGRLTFDLDHRVANVDDKPLMANPQISPGLYSSRRFSHHKSKKRSGTSD